ncbi:phenylacetic acid degradation protein paaN [Luminiphilus syltensis NOR5-1B]|uniref:Phenylacetic acid degradation protein paaN n=1 Tax=Luminiphilus syltensis NOR5-1B TaxID=565045 RepID=B8KT85_9GAMM|nr:phenylacetic acid degradation bifunctional protein PaaZ [Luminiphilus syltensis]EED36686.1 phenylacetic acid degradation protein paaN [Luminiphilus syltensis NOR5-1B]
MKLTSYVAGAWVEGQDEGKLVVDAVRGEPVCRVSSAGIDFAKVVQYARDVAGPKLRAMTFIERAAMLKALAKHLMTKKEDFYTLSFKTGTTRADAWPDVEGGIGTVFSFASLVNREFPNDVVMVEGEMERLSQQGTFVGRHILTSKPGVAVHINAYNFPIWGMLEKIAPSLAAGVPVIVKPATQTAYLTQACVREMVDSGLLPEGAVQLICGSTGDLLDHLNEQDVVTFTGSASTGKMLRNHPNLLANSVPFNMEADSLNCAILGQSVKQGDPEFDLFVKEVVREMTTKAGQKCTAIRRVIVPEESIDAVIDAISARLKKAVMGDPELDGVRLGALVSTDQVDDVRDRVEQLSAEAAIVFGGDEAVALEGLEAGSGAFYPATLLRCDNPLQADRIHSVEAFGPVATVMPYQSLEDAVTLARMGKGSLVGSLFTHDPEEARTVILGAAPWHGRMLVLDRDCAKESTGHGSPLANLVHGGPGRAGGGEELGGARAVKHYLQRTALQGSPTSLMGVTREYHAGAKTFSDGIHPFKKHFEALQIGETLVTHRRTVTEADIVNFGCISGDHFYAHFDAIAAKDSFFGERVAHGYFVISAAAGMFVDPNPGPVIANYGLENLRFVEPVPPGTTIQAKLSVKRKIKKPRREGEKPNGVVVWAVEVTNQEGEPVALYDILTLVVRQDED